MTDTRNLESKSLEDHNGYAKMFNNLRILSCLEPGDYISVDSDNNIYCRWSASWWNTLTSTLKMETWTQTYDCLKDIYCVKLPTYIKKVDAENEKDYQLEDLLRVCRNGLTGLKKLKQVYNYSYQSKSGGVYDANFDTLIDSFAVIQIKQIKRLIKKEKKRKIEEDEVSSDSEEKEDTTSDSQE